MLSTFYKETKRSSNEKCSASLMILSFLVVLKYWLFNASLSAVRGYKKAKSLGHHN